MAKGESLQEGFRRRCDENRLLWNKKMEEALDSVGGNQPGAQAKVAARFARNAREEVQRLDNELTRFVALAAAILTATALLFAAAALKPSDKTFMTFLAIGLCFAAIAFSVTLLALAPPIKRSLFTPYVSRYEFTLLVYDDYTDWVFHCWFGERRTAVLTKYKKALAIAASLLVFAAGVVASGAVLNLF